MTKLSIVIVSWNTSDLLAACLNSVYAFQPSESFEVWVVDNDSKDNSVQMVRDCFPQVVLIENENNVGFAQANNQAIDLCRGEYVLLLNPDTEVKANALDALVTFLDETPQAGGAGSRLLNPDGSLQRSCHPAPTLKREFWRLFHMDTFRPYGVYDIYSWDTNLSREVDVLQGASLLVRKEILDTIGFLDGDYFMYSEEVDLCFRIQQAGWKLYWVPISEVIHYGGQSTKQVATEMFMQLYLGKLKYFRKHYGRFAGLIYKLILVLAAIARIIFTPIYSLIKPAYRKRIFRLAGQYQRLLVALPRM